MPNFYAHIRFCLAVRRQLPPRLRATLTAERDMFLCGGFGPDPLYFYAGHRGAGEIRREGLRLHHHSGAEAMERLRQPVLEKRPFAVSFSAGYLLHYLLDARCHPYVYQVVEQGRLSHFALEAEFDRYLLARDGLSYQQALPRKELPADFYGVAAEMFEGLTPEVYRRALGDFRWVSLKFGRWVGKPVRHAVNAVSRIPAAHPIRGMILSREVEEAAKPHLTELDRLCQEAVAPAAVELGRFFGAVEAGMPFSDALGRDFSGKEGV